MAMDSLWEILQWWALVQCANTGQLQLGWHRLLEDSKFNQPSKSARIFPGGLDLGSPGRASFPAQWLHHAVVEKTLRQCAKLVKQRKATWQTFPWALMFCTKMLSFEIGDFGIIEHLGVHADFVQMSHLVASWCCWYLLMIRTRNLCPTLVFMSNLSTSDS